jgi:NAD+ kinase
VEPEAHSILITPVCAHDVISRPIVASESRVITVGLTHNARRNAFLSVDGGKATKINMGDLITIRKSRLSTKLVRLKNRSFYEKMRYKFH